MQKGIGKEGFVIVIMLLFVGVDVVPNAFAGDMKTDNNSFSIITSDLVAYWSFDNQTNPGYDDSGNNNKATLYGPTWTNDSALNGGLSFDGINDYTLTPHNEILDFSDENCFSLCLWVKSSGALVSSEEGIISFGSYDNKLGFGINREVKNKTIAFVICDGTNECILFSNNITLDYFWYHIAVVWNGNAMYIYINGLLDKLATLTSFNYADDYKPLEFGNHWGYTDNHHPFHGILDEIRIYNRALNEKEVLNLYNILEINTKGGRGINIHITNIGPSNAIDVDWQITVKGGVLGLINVTKRGSIEMIAPGASIQVGTEMFFGLGEIQITTKVDEDNVVVNATQLFIFTRI